jgi:hypothetical protein
LRKICDLSASLDGYKEELHPEFTSEANVFYTTIKNVNYPPKDENWVAKVGSSALMDVIYRRLTDFCIVNEKGISLPLKKQQNFKGFMQNQDTSNAGDLESAYCSGYVLREIS